MALNENDSIWNKTKQIFIVTNFLQLTKSKMNFKTIRDIWAASHSLIGMEN